MEREQIVKQSKQAMSQILAAVNYMGLEKELSEAMLATLLNDHRTIQQSFWRTIRLLAKQYGETQHFDQRNEASVKFAKEVGEIQMSLPFI